jgi:ABC-type branched-subunit amino acid transport system ATPase component
MTVVYRASGLEKRFGDLRAVDGVDLAIEEGEIRAIIGPNGAGKTTLFNLLTGYLKPDRGRIELRGEEITHLPVHAIARKGVARSFQVTSIFPRLSVFENVWLAVHARATPNGTTGAFDEATWRVLELVGLAHRAGDPAGTLAHGDQRLLEIGLTVGVGGFVLLLDEPTAGVSPEDTDATVSLIRRLAPRHTIVLVEHDMDLVMRISHHISVLHRGRIIAEGRPEQIRRNAAVREAYLGSLP